MNWTDRYYWWLILRCLHKWCHNISYIMIIVIETFQDQAYTLTQYTSALNNHFHIVLYILCTGASSAKGTEATHIHSTRDISWHQLLYCWLVHYMCIQASLWKLRMTTLYVLVWVSVGYLWLVIPFDFHYANQWVLPEARHIHELMTMVKCGSLCIWHYSYHDTAHTLLNYIF